MLQNCFLELFYFLLPNNNPTKMYLSNSSPTKKLQAVLKHHKKEIERRHILTLSNAVSTSGVPVSHVTRQYLSVCLQTPPSASFLADLLCLAPETVLNRSTKLKKVLLKQIPVSGGVLQHVALHPFLHEGCHMSKAMK